MSDAKFRVPPGSLNIYALSMNNRKWMHLHFFSVNHFHSWILTESKWIYNFTTRSKPSYKFNRKWLAFHFFCAVLCLFTTLSLFTDCKVPVFSLHANSSPWFPPPIGEQCPCMRILIAISVCILACMSTIWLIWWFHASLSSACTSLFVFSNCKI